MENGQSNSGVYPYLIYCVSVWGSTYQSSLSLVFILQKKAIRIISKVSFDSHTDVLFKEHRILKFFDIYFYQISKFTYLFKRGLLPNYFRNMFYHMTHTAPRAISLGNHKRKGPV